MKDRSTALTFLIVSCLLFGPMCAKSNDERIISFAIPVGDNLMNVLGDQTQARKRSVAEMLESVGVVCHAGSEVSLDHREGKIFGRLAHSQALLVVALAQMLSDSSVEEIRLYFNPPSECFPPKAAAKPSVPGQPAKRPGSR